MRTILAASACLALLAACSDGASDNADKADADGKLTSEEMASEVAAAGDEITMRPGQWENTIEFTEFDIPGVPEKMKDFMTKQMGSAMTTTSCLTQEEADRPNAGFFGGEKNDNCTYDKFDHAGGNLTLRMTCATDEGGTAKIAMDGKFGDESFTLTMDNRISGTRAGDVTMKGTVTGKRIGDCPA
ncbi:DUF3617 domain-containing protein [Citromicrobium bathyomarinum]|uniref:DUF3617 domain-containing protein n=1 Tax=Sphingomonadales TaxID=204457 RepID=UPI0006C8EDCB|nr:MULTISPECIES: DUF3617 domain-containing protein [Sphingomonadales]MAO03458.1 DUF3617 domain-containing protein [Citromicrobium sp.]KPM18430.1 hypothetical protein WG75_04325 [Citromicrobium sp. WPS32]KPM24671.1 hypothetical protein AAJ72_02675 [Citromicrobium sp. RCC1885]KPM27913.1 hypothetical protein AAJ74_03420 [Citromicrobium sp. RCC1878]MAY76679.1 DUF3617 domain-containing protein [Citromicrobium sp.]|tara:strand:+ start:115 stop:672 length:558 start_codon:yes stop_codon:yes gene_type:complete